MERKSSGLLIAAFLALAMALTGCNKDSSNSYTVTSVQPKSAPPNTVVISGSSFGPATLTVARNSAVIWRNDDAVAHSSTSDDGSWDTGLIPPGSSKTTTYAVPGSFTYHCKVHLGMTGTLVVQ